MSPFPAHGTRPDALHVLVVDDDPTTALLLADALEQDGARVSVAGTAEEARALLADGHRPDVLVSDWLLPGADGIDLCAWVRDAHADASIPVLLISGAAERDVRLRALAQGADDLISKPIDPLELRARVRSMADLSRARSALARRDRIDAVLAELTDGVALLDAEGAVVDANRRAHALLSLPAGGVGDLEAHLAATFELEGDVPASAVGPRTLALHRPRRGAEPALWVEVLLVPVPGGEGGTAAVVRDVTATRAAQDLADVVLASVAHKLRTPMTGITSVANSLDRFVEEGPGQQLVGILQRSAQRLDASLARIIEHAAAVARGEDDVPVVLRPGQVAMLLQHVVGDHVHDVVAEVVDEVERPVRVALGPLRVALDEFVDNARAAGDDRPSLRIATQGDTLVVEVADRGAGFAPEEAEAIFEPFHQEDRTGQDPRMGLGLPLVRHLAGRAGGRVRASSVAGGLTTFALVLPAMALQGQTGGVPATPGATPATLTSHPVSGAA